MPNRIWEDLISVFHCRRLEVLHYNPGGRRTLDQKRSFYTHTFPNDRLVRSHRTFAKHVIRHHGIPRTVASVTKAHYLLPPLIAWSGRVRELMLAAMPNQ